MKEPRLCEYCPYPSKAAVTSIVVKSAGTHRTHAQRVFVCAEHLAWYRNEEMKEKKSC